MSKKLSSKKLLIVCLTLIAITVTGFVFVSGYDDNIVEVVKTTYKGQHPGSGQGATGDGSGNIVSDTKPVGQANEPGIEESGEGAGSDNGADGDEAADGATQTKVSKASDYKPDAKLVIFPKSFPVADNQLVKIHQQLDAGRSMDYPQVFRYNNVETPQTNKKSDALEFTNFQSNSFHNHPFSIFNSYKTIDEDKGKCGEISDSFEVGVTSKTSMDGNLEDIVRRLVDLKPPVYKEVSEFFKKDIGNQFKDKTIDKHWYRLAGTSVWLEQYGVHFMISRVIYSPEGSRNRPVFSLTYAQLYNENWEELLDTELVVPTNDPESIHKQIDLDGTFYTSIKYPSFIPIPAFHDPKILHNRYYGPEDPRLLLTKNQNGHEEPLIVYNAYHKKIDKNTEVDETHGSLSYKYYRSMFMSLPWQFQRGKRNINELPDEQSDSMIYSKAIELRRKGLDRLPIQKNWTPLVDFKDRQQYGYDKYVYFIYRWSNLEVLRCELTDVIGSSSGCEFAYRMNEQLGNGSPVGALRGGTEMININGFVEDYNLQSKISIPNDKEIFIGFARAHLTNCGCGNDIYRPNLVVIIKDLRTNQYKIDAISSFVSLDVPLIGWDLENPDKVCEGGPSVFIPNGISSWSVRDGEENKDDFEDYLTMSFSLTDATVDIIHIKGLLKAVMNKLKYIAAGYNNDNVECALDGSEKFCQKLGELTQKHLL